MPNILDVYDEMLSSGIHPIIRNPVDFSRHLVAAYLTNANLDRFARLKKLWNQALLKSCKTTLNRYFQTFYPNGVLAARGLTRLSVTSRDELNSVYFGETEKADAGYRCYSLNTTKAASSFAARKSALTAREILQNIKRHHHRSARAKLFLGRIEAARISGMTATQAVAICETPVVIVSQLPYADILGFGMDSESSFPQEAEIHVRGNDLTYATDIFALATWPIGRGLASARDIRYFGLDRYHSVLVNDDWYYNRLSESLPFHILLHPAAPVEKIDIPTKSWVVNINPVWRWYRL